MLGSHDIAQPHTNMDTQYLSALGAHVCVWSSMNCEQPRNICGCTQSQSTRPQDFMGAHILWVGSHKLYMSTHTLRMVAQTCGNIHAFMGDHDIVCGLPWYCSGHSQYRLHDHDGLWMHNNRSAWAPRKNLKPHAFCWTATNCRWAPTRRYMDAYVMHVHAHTCTRYAHSVGMGAYMYAHENMWARIMHAHARRNGKTPTPLGSRRFGSRCGLWLYSKAITAWTRDFACFGSALPTSLSKSPEGWRLRKTVFATSSRSRVASAVSLACL